MHPVRPYRLLAALAFFWALLAPQLGARAQAPGDPPLPAGEKLTWGEEPVESVSRARAQICLNGIWRFHPAPAPAPEAPADGWGFIRVPGDWREQWGVPGIVARGNGPAWQNYNGAELARAWYQRRLRIPLAWQGQAILLDFQRVSTDALVSVNGVACGRVEWPAGTVEITKAVKPGEECTLDVLVVAAKQEADVLALMDTNQPAAKAGDLASRGIIGDVLLCSRPAGAHVSDVFVQPSVRRKELALDVELSGVREAGPVQFTAHLLDEKGNEEKSFTSPARVEAAETQKVRLSWAWPNPRLWDVGQPNLYTLVLEVEGAGLADAYAQRFGFREFWIERRRFLLNGTEIRLRPIVDQDETPVGSTQEAIDAKIDGMTGAGFNIQELWPSDHDERGSIQYRELICERADLKGWPVIAPALSISRYGFPWSMPNWAEPGVKERWEKRMAAELRRYRNHPAILMWTTSPNTFGHGDDQNPVRIGKRRENEVWHTADPGWHQYLAYGDEATNLIKTHDPTRRVLVHEGGPVGDVYALDSYLNLIPLQEREEWLSEWAQHGSMPFMAVEFGTPLHTSLMRGRNGAGWNGGGACHSEPLLTEFCAIYFGAEAYGKESPEYRGRIPQLFRKGQEYQSWFNVGELDFAPNMQLLESLFNTNTYRSWRTTGITGGMNPWAYGHGWQHPWPQEDQQVDIGPFQPGRRGPYVRKIPRYLMSFLRPEGNTISPSGQAILANNGPTLAWIAGPASAFTAKEHSFFAGQRVEKQAALLNDNRQAQPFSFSWEAVLDGKTVASGSDHGRIEPAKTLFFPIRFEVPAALAGARAEGEIRLTANIGQRVHQDRFSFRAFARVAPVKRDLFVFDPPGRTTQLLKSLGCTVRRWRGEMDAGLVIIGRTALSRGYPLPGDLEAFVRGGGRALVFTQDPQWMAKALGLRVCPDLSRRVFPLPGAHPVTAGLDAEDLRDWAGVSELVEATPDYIGDRQLKKSPNEAPWWGWHWGNRGAVSSAAIEKPHRSGWRPILECEFDLAYSPLMELDYGAGRLIWCTLDLEEHAPLDPAAATLAQQLLDYAAKAPLAPRAAKVIYLGGPTGAALLDSLGVLYQRADGLQPDAQLVLLGSDANVSQPALQAYLAGGGKALFLPRSGSGAALGVSIAQVKGFGGSLQVPDWPEARGLSPSDLRWRADADAWLVKEGCQVGAGGQLGRLAVGTGVAIFCQIDPERFNADERTYFRYTRWRQTRALAQVLANLGAAFKMDGRIFIHEDPDRDRISLAGKWRAKLTAKLPPAPDNAHLHPDPGISEATKQLVGEGVDDAGWQEVTLPGYMDSWGAEWANADGEALFRREIEVPENLVGKDLVLSLGALDDFDDAFFNGAAIGHTDRNTPSFWSAPRTYTVPGKLVKAGKNVIAVRIFDQYLGGGFVGQPWQMSLEPKRAGKPAEGFYHPDYRDDFELGDDPYRYYRW